MLDLVSSVLHREIRWEECLQNFPFCVNWDVKPYIKSGGFRWNKILRPTFACWWQLVHWVREKTIEFSHLYYLHCLPRTKSCIFQPFRQPACSLFGNTCFSVVTVSKSFLSVSFGRFCRKNLGFRFGLGFHDKRVVNFFMTRVIWHDFHHR